MRLFNFTQFARCILRRRRIYNCRLNHRAIHLMCFIQRGFLYKVDYFVEC